MKHEQLSSVVSVLEGTPALNRRGFLRSAIKFLAVTPLLNVFGGSMLSRLQLNFYQKAFLRRNTIVAPVTVYKMVALPGSKYSKADVNHMANKIFPSIDAARARRPHRAFFYGLKLVSLPATLVNGMDGETLFCRRKDLDCRVARDRRHWQKLGVDVNAVFGVVKNA